MRFYRIAFRRDGGGSAGFAFARSRVEANKIAREAVRDDPDEYRDRGPDIDRINVTLTKAGILAALYAYASHPNNG